MRCAAILALSAAAVAADPGVGIVRWGGTLIVTAPATDIDAATGRRLAMRIAIDLQAVPAPEAFDRLAGLCGVAIAIDPRVRAAPPPITLRVSAMPASSVLRWMAELSGLVVSPVPGGLYVSAEPVPGPSRTALYDVSDLAFQPPDLPGRTAGFAAADLGGNAPAPAPAPSPAGVEAIEELLRRHLRLP